MSIRPICVYLSGPIDNVSQDDAKNWREEVAAMAGTGVVLFSPAHAYLRASLAAAQAVDRMNRAAVFFADGLLANLSGPGRAVGTCREIEFARGHGKPVAVVGGRDHETSLSLWDVEVVGSLQEGLDFVVQAVNDAREAPSLAQMFFRQQGEE